jgi:hypothetical protein
MGHIDDMEETKDHVQAQSDQGHDHPPNHCIQNCDSQIGNHSGILLTYKFKNGRISNINYDTLLDGTGFPEKETLHLSPLPHLGRGMG